MEVTVYSIEDGKQLGLDYGLEGAGGLSGGSIEGLACIHVFMVIMAAKRSTAWKVGLRLCSAGFTKSAKRSEPPQMVPSMSTERPRASGKLAHKKPLTGATPYGEATETRVATEEGGVTTDGGYVDRSVAGQRKCCPGGDSNPRRPLTYINTSELLAWAVTDATSPDEDQRYVRNESYSGFNSEGFRHSPADPKKNKNLLLW